MYMITFETDRSIVDRAGSLTPLSDDMKMVCCGTMVWTLSIVF